MQQEQLFDPLGQMVHLIADMIDNPTNLFLFIEAKKHAGKYNKMLNLQAILNKLVLNDEEYYEKFKKNLLTIFSTLIQDKNFSFLFKGFLEFIKINQEKLALNYKAFLDQDILEMARKVRSDSINLFLNAFKINDQFTQQDFLDWYVSLINQKQFDDAFVFYKEMKLDVKEFHYLIKQMNTSESCSKAGQFIKKAGFDARDFPEIIKRQIKSTAYYYYKTFTWYKIEELLGGQPKIQTEVCYLLEKNQQAFEAFTIIIRNNLQQQIDNQHFLKKFQAVTNDPNFALIENILFTKDAFLPTDQLENPTIEYLTAQEFGYTQDKVLFIDYEDKLLTFAIENILGSTLTGYDTEFVSPMYQLDEAKQILEIIQIATPSYAFIFDIPKLQNSKIFVNFMREYLENPQIGIIGHTVDEDLLLSSKALQLRGSKISKILDVSTYASKISDSKSKSLAYISETLFKKPLSKLDQRSRWGARPLRQAQLHYAAMDAIVCLKIYDILVQKFQDVPFKQIEKLVENEQLE